MNIKTSRQSFLKHSAAACFSSLTAPLFSATGNKDRPNFLFVLTDDQRFDTLGCAGHPHVKTPVIDGLAEKGMRFKNAFVTTSICMASRANIFTGLTTTSHGFCSGNFGNKVIADDVNSSFPSLLRKAGYRTGFFGKQHVKFAGNKEPAMDNIAMNEMFDKWKRIGRNPYIKTMPDGSKKHCAEIIGSESRDFINNHPEGKPFCLYMSFNISHGEDKDLRPGIHHFAWPKKENGLYEDIIPPQPKLEGDKYREKLPEFLKDTSNRRRYHWRWDTEEKYRLNMRAYWRMLTGMDRIVGTVIETLKQKGLDKNTVIIFSSDNGYYLGDRGFCGKWTHFEESLRVPMIIYDPRVQSKQKNRTSEKMALSIDIPATIVDMAGIPIPDKYQGRSLAPLLGNFPQQSWRKEFFHEFHYQSRGIPSYYGIRNERYVYAHYYNEKHEFLHDLQKDPTQLVNYATDPEYTAILKQMREQKDAYIKKYTRPEITAAREKAKGKKTTGRSSEKRKKPEPVHIFILSGQSNMAHVKPEVGFTPEITKLMKGEKVVHIKVAKGGQPICMWVEEWRQIAEKHQISPKRIDIAYSKSFAKKETTLFYKPILEQYKELLKKYPNPASVTFCWMQGERDASGGFSVAYYDALKQLISNLRRDLKRPDMNIVIGRIGDVQLDSKKGWVEVREAQIKIAKNDPHGAWVDVDDLNNRMNKKTGKVENAVHYTKEGYELLGRRFARQGYALIKGKKPTQNGRP